MPPDHKALYEAVDRLGHKLRDLDLPLDIPGAEGSRRVLQELVGQIDDYLLPRLEQIEAPLVAVVGGSTGAGKSTIVNSLLGREVSPAGVLRPTTTTPVLVCNPDDLRWFNSGRILPGLPRLTGSHKRDAEGLVLISDADLPPGLALLDAPDVDSVVERNRELAAQLLAAADFWLFVTTAARYADAVPWEFLRIAKARSTALAVVLNRVPEEAAEEVPGHLSEMLRKEGLGGTPVITIREAALNNGLVPDANLERLRGWLDALAADADARTELVQVTLQGALASLDDRIEILATHLEAQIAAAAQLAADARRTYDAALGDIEEGLSGGPLLRAEVLARWHEFIGTGDVMRSLQSAIGRVRDRVSDALLGRPPVEAEVRTAVERSIETVVVAACDRAAERTVASWTATPQGDALVARGDVPGRSSPELGDMIEGQIRAWQGYVLELVSAQGTGKRAAGRAVSLGVNSLGAALMIAVFAHTGGLTGGEVVIAGGTAAVSQRLLEALFGDQAVRDLTSAARKDLIRRVKALVDAERGRFDAVATGMTPDPELPAQLRASKTEIAETRT